MNNPIRTIEFACACGKGFRARTEQGGKTYACPSCGVPVRVPQVSTVTGSVPPIGPSAAAAAAATAAEAGRLGDHPPLGAARHAAATTQAVPAPGATARRLLTAPATFGQMLLYFMASWGSVAFFCLVLSLFSSPFIRYGSLLAFLMMTGATAQQIWVLMRARQRVLSEKDVPLLWGFVRLLAWDPIEGLLILRNKGVAFSDDNLQDAQGGVRFLYPILGEEVALRVPLEVQTLQFSDENVLTREYLSVRIRGTMKWRIVDVCKFYLLVSRELRSTTNHDDHVSQAGLLRGGEAARSTIQQLMRAAIEWLRVLTEEQTRLVVSRAKSGLLIADRLTRELVPSHSGTTTAPSGEGALTAELGNATDGLAGAIHDTLAHRLEQYGIAVEDVSLQEIRLPEEVMQECIEAAKAYYYPLLGKREAARKVSEMAAQAEILGPDAIATREVVKNAPAFAMVDFFSTFVQKRLGPKGGADGATAAAMAALAAQGSQPQGPALPGGDGQG